MVIINKTLHIIFAAGQMFRPGTNVVDGDVDFSEYEKTAFVGAGLLKVVDAKSDSDTLEAILNSTDKESVKELSEKSKSKSVKAAAEKRAKEIADADAEFDKAIAEQEAKKQKAAN